MFAARKMVTLGFMVVALSASVLSGCGTADPATEATSTEVASFHDEGLLGNALSRAEVKTVLKLIDDICGDTWCEGDNDFRFRYLFCESEGGSCTLLLQTGARVDPPALPRWRWQSCRTPGFLGFDSLVNTTASGYQSLTDGYYEALTTCVGEFEAAP